VARRRAVENSAGSGANIFRRRRFFGVSPRHSVKTQINAITSKRPWLRVLFTSDSAQWRIQTVYQGEGGIHGERAEQRFYQETKPRPQKLANIIDRLTPALATHAANKMTN